jgi:hypothetical protein
MTDPGPASEHGAGPGGLEVPSWLVGDAGWWAHALGAPGASDHLEPVGVDRRRRLVVVADSVAYATHLRAASAGVAGRVNERVPEADLAGVVVVMRPVIVLVVTDDEFTDYDLMADVLPETWHDAVQDVGPAHPVVFQHVDETPADQFITQWAQQHPGTTPVVRASAYRADSENGRHHAAQMRNAALVDDGPGYCLTFCAKGRPIPTLARLAHGKGWTSREVWA